MGSAGVAMVGWWWASEARAESWCAAPLVAHEWGVVRVGASGAGPAVPPWFARAQEAAPLPGPRVRDLPADGGERDLPVISLYTTDSWSFPVPFALEVSFTAGTPSVWWPPVDALGHRSLAWEALALVREPASPPRPAAEPWVAASRAHPGALWVQRGADTERFVFYEGRTQESSALVLSRGDSWSPTRPHYVVENVTDRPVHDVVVVADGRAWTAPMVPAHKTAGFLLEAKLDPAALRAELRGRWSAGAPPAGNGWGPDCVMMRDPAVPVTVAVDHVLYPSEVDVLLDTWDHTLFAPRGTRLVYREDVAAVDAAVPARLYTDQFHWVDWHRLSVVLVEGVKLP